MSKRKRRSLRELSGLEELSQAIADAIEGPVVTCVEYKKGKKGMRCARFEPTQGVIDSEFPYKVRWEARSELKRPNVYVYNRGGIYRRARRDSEGNVIVYGEPKSLEVTKAKSKKRKKTK